MKGIEKIFFIEVRLIRIVRIAIGVNEHGSTFISWPAMMQICIGAECFCYGVYIYSEA